MSNWAELISMAATVPTVVCAIAVIAVWGQDALRIVLREKPNNWRDTDYLVVGIAIAFFGSAIDNVYWAVAWSANYLQMDSADFWFQSGVYVNIPARQVCGILAGFLHLKGFFVAREQGHYILASLMATSFFGGVLFAFALWAFKTWG